MATRYERRQQELLRKQDQTNRQLQQVRDEAWNNMTIQANIFRERDEALETVLNFEKRLAKLSAGPGQHPQHTYMALAELQQEFEATGVTSKSVQALNEKARIRQLEEALDRSVAAAYGKMSRTELNEVEACLSYEEEMQSLELAHDDQRARERLPELEDALEPLVHARPDWLTQLLLVGLLAAIIFGLMALLGENLGIGLTALVLLVSTGLIFLFTSETSEPEGLPLISERSKLQKQLVHDDTRQELIELFGSHSAAEYELMLAQRRDLITKVRG